MISLTELMCTILSQIAILGASGYTGAELTRILLSHPHASLEVLTADRSAGQDFKSIYPQFSYRKDLPKLTKWEDSQKDIEKCDVAFCCLPHGTTQEIISKLAQSPVKVKSTPTAFIAWMGHHNVCYILQIIDLSADFRLKDINSYEKVMHATLIESRCNLLA